MWEDYNSGMYNSSNDDGLIQKAIELLSDAKLCREYMQKVVTEWPIATEEVLTNPDSNGRAWLGNVLASCMADVMMRKRVKRG